MNDVKNERVAQALESIRDMKYIPKELEAAIKEAKPPRYVKTQGPDVTDKKVDTLLTDLYYKKGYTLGRDNLWLLLRDEYPTLRRDQVGAWLETQKLYQLYKRSSGCGD